MIEFIIPIKVDSKLGLNSVYSGNKHWAVRKKQASEVHELVGFSLRKYKILRKCYDVPVDIEISYNSRLDIDNHGYLAKLIIDGLKDYLIKDDSKKYVRRVDQRFWTGQGIRVRLQSSKNAEKREIKN